MLSVDVFIERECVLYAVNSRRVVHPPLRLTGSGSLVQLGIPKLKSEGTLSSGFRRNETAQGGMRQDGDTTLRYNINFGVQRSCWVYVYVECDFRIDTHTNSCLLSSGLSSYV